MQVHLPKSHFVKRVETFEQNALAYTNNITSICQLPLYACIDEFQLFRPAQSRGFRAS